jgi:hypothetical protein
VLPVVFVVVADMRRTTSVVKKPQGRSLTAASSSDERLRGLVLRRAAGGTRMGPASYRHSTLPKSRGNLELTPADSGVSSPEVVAGSAWMLA